MVRGGKALRSNLLLSELVLFVLICSSLVVSVDAASTWSQVYGGEGDDRACSVIATSDGGYAIAGTTDSFGASGDFWLVKTDANGVMEWNRAYGGAGDDVACSLVATSDGGYALAGTWNDSQYYGGTAYYGDFWLVKTDALGHMQWNRTYGGAGLDKACSLVTTSDGGYALAGTWNYLSTWEFNHFTGGDFWLLKTDASGNIEWNRTYGGAGNDVASSLAATSDGGFALAGTWNYTTYYGLGFYGDFWLVKTDALGNMLWNGKYGETGDDNKGEYASSLVAASDGGYTIAGTLNFMGGLWLLKTDGSGKMQWNRTYVGLPSVSGFSASSLVATSDGGYSIAGYAVSSDYSGEGCWLAKTDALGNMQWNQTYVETGGLNVDGSWSLIATSDGGYALAGGRLYRPIGAGSYDFWLVKTDSVGVVPEFSSWLIPSLALAATGLFVFSKKSLFHAR
jgi:hypothetical protein